MGLSHNLGHSRYSNKFIDIGLNDTVMDKITSVLMYIYPYCSAISR